MTTKTKTLLTTDAPVRGVEYDKARPETREPWLNQRRGGLTATEVRDWGNPTKRRKIINAKVTGEFEDLSHILAVNHGNLREPVIADWVMRKFGITPCDYVYSRFGEPRHLASPDGVTLDPFTGDLVVGVPDAVLSEIKASKHDLTPGEMDASNVLITIEHGSHFDRSDYYIQMQWQMYVMNAVRTLFVWEQHDGTVDPETGTYRPIGVPKWAWVLRDRALIERLVNERAPKALAEIDAARAAVGGAIPPASDADTEVAQLTADLLKARDAEAAAKKAKEKAWAALQEIFLAKEEGAEYPADASVDLGFAQITVNTNTKPAMKFNADGARRRAPKLIAQYEALVKRYTKPVDETKTTFTVTAKKEEK